MRVKAINVAFLLIVSLLVGLFAFEDSIYDLFESFREFRLSEVKLETMSARKFRIPQSHDGYVVFYSDVLKCTGCVRELSLFKKLLQSYEGLAFFAIVKNDQYKQSFAELMSHYEIPGEYLVDVRGKIQKRLGLADHPMLLFFNSEQHLIAMMPLDVDHEKLLRQFHRYIAVM